MKKIIFAFSFFLLILGTAFAQESGYQYTFSVINISKDNQNAETIGAQPGDVLRYEMLFECGEGGMKNIVPTVDITQILQAGEIIDIGTGILEGNTLTFPELNESGTCKKSLTFFVRIKENCGNRDHIQTNAMQRLVNVPLTCDLSSTGPLFKGIALFGLIFGTLLFFVFVNQKRLRSSQ